jgi:hypothetical protein
MGDFTQFAPRALTVAEEQLLDEVHARVEAFVRWEGVRGLDAVAIAAEIVESWLQRRLRQSPCSTPAPPSRLDVRCAVSSWRRREARIHAREVKAGGLQHADGDPAAPLEAEEERRAMCAALRQALVGLELDDLRALSMRVEGATLAEVAAALGGTGSRWWRREFETRGRLRCALSFAWSDADASSRSLLDAFREAMERSCPQCNVEASASQQVSKAARQQVSKSARQQGSKAA